MAWAVMVSNILSLKYSYERVYAYTIMCKSTFLHNAVVLVVKWPVGVETLMICISSGDTSENILLTMILKMHFILHGVIEN